MGRNTLRRNRRVRRNSRSRLHNRQLIYTWPGRIAKSGPWGRAQAARSDARACENRIRFGLAIRFQWQAGNEMGETLAIANGGSLERLPSLRSPLGEWSKAVGGILGPCMYRFHLSWPKGSIVFRFPRNFLEAINITGMRNLLTLIAIRTRLLA